MAQAAKRLSVQTRAPVDLNNVGVRTDARSNVQCACATAVPHTSV